ncbi:threonine ammonia-lyase [Azospirillum rugosum]|uniref:Threonine dehydratase n=1 Tax=Azospirillum rugosum TaxID=416170 RepID=A0ABS4SVB3_9PROT|nr:threonine ammonia-lyase [Azospirillum rugosum]MBP2296499.1 threonine dehydratase [Azospirillum rugosum]MDQ0530101.1 threonine dehydratase [Azospirillum rugosum]
MPVTIDDIRAAAARISGRVGRTPFLKSETLSAITGAEVWVKLENLQFTASFKERGAANRLLLLSAEERAAGVIAMSAGNHAQAVAYHAKKLGIAATIVMPRFTPFVKVKRTRYHGATVILEGDSLAEAAAFAHDLAKREGLVFVHPYDDDAVIAGQGTAILEMLEEMPELDCLAIPVGGGGLAAGAAVAARALCPNLEVIGVEVETYPAAAQRLAGQPVKVGGPTVAEGIAVRDVGERPMDILKQHGCDVVLVPEVTIERAIAMLIEVEKTVSEGAGAAGLAALLFHPERFRGKRVGLMVSGGNIDTRTLANVLMRGFARDGRLLNLEVDIADQPGALAQVTRIVAECGGNIVEVQHQRLFGAFSVKSAEVELLIEVEDEGHGDRLIAALQQASLPVRKAAVSEATRPILSAT